MHQPAHRSGLLPWVGMVAACLVTIIFVVIFLRYAPIHAPPSSYATPVQLPANVEQGVRVSISANGRTVETALPVPAFSLGAGESLDARVEAGPFEAVFTVTYSRGGLKRGAVGAEFAGGQLTIERRGVILATEASAGETRRVMSGVYFADGPLDTVTFRFRKRDDKPARLLALWQPEEAPAALPLPVEGRSLLADDAHRGMVLFQQFNCIACHASSDPSLKALLAVSPAPNLDRIGARVRPAWIRSWLSDPAAMKRGANMPSVLHHLDPAASAEQIEDLTHFLVSQGGPLVTPHDARDENVHATGMMLFHSVGCVACHGPLEALASLPGGRTPLPGTRLIRDYASLGKLAEKTAHGPLAAFLVDPVAMRPSGRMPSQNLEPFEADAIARYLIERLSNEQTHVDTAGFTPEPMRIERGMAAFASLGCANCHEIPSVTLPAERRAGPNLESLAASAAQSVFSGCLSEQVGSAPRFELDSTQRAALATFIASVPDRRASNVPHEQLAATMTRLNCIACHSFHGARGPEAAITDFFTTTVEADIGEEGRMPPNLSFVGARLQTDWMREVLERGGRARPYMATRMPQFGKENIGHVPGLLASMAGQSSERAAMPAPSADTVAAGRRLVGEKGLNCIQCHGVAGRDSTGVPGPDLGQMTMRLRPEAFSRWLHDPTAIRPGTRMPSFFVGGFSAVTDVLGGRADEQIDAMWAYLSQGERMLIPDGLADTGGFDLDPIDEPVVFRSFMKDGGVRAIAVGFPNRIHYAFDQDRCAVSMVWQGRFLSARNAWANRGGSQTNPESKPLALPGPVLGRLDGDLGERKTFSPGVVKFIGYRLDDQRRPAFRFSLAVGDRSFEVVELPVPSSGATAQSLTRMFTVTGAPGSSLAVRTDGMILEMSIGESRIVSPAVAEVTLDPAGRAAFKLELPL